MNRLRGLRTATAAMLCSLLLAGCGPEEASAPANGAGKSSGGDAQAAVASPEASASCPPTITTPAPSGGPVSDIVGLRLGLTYDEVADTLACREGGLNIESSPRWAVMQTYNIPTRQVLRAVDGVECDSQEILRDMNKYGKPTCGGRVANASFRLRKNVSDVFYVTFTGVQGEERAGGLWRSVTFPEAGRPTVESLTASLTQKYGEPHVRDTNSRRRGVSMIWQYDQLGRPMSQANNAFHGCAWSLSPDFTQQQSWQGGCGLTVSAFIEPNAQNDLLADAMHTVVMDQGAFLSDSEAFEAALKAESERAKIEQAASAAGNAAKPDL